MPLYIQSSLGSGSMTGTLDPQRAEVDLIVIADDTSLSLGPIVANRQKVNYSNTAAPPGSPQFALTWFTSTPNIDFVILPVTAGFQFGGTFLSHHLSKSLPPNNSGLPDASLNPTNDYLIIYDTSDNSGQGFCVSRKTWMTGLPTPPIRDLPMPTWAILYHEFMHTNELMFNSHATLAAEENDAIFHENKLRVQVYGANAKQRDAQDHGANPGCQRICCIVASVATGSPLSPQVQELRSIRDNILRTTEIGFSFFKELFRDYYSFSPQVCTLMAKEPRLSPLVLAGFVDPLLKMLKIAQAYSLKGYDDPHLGKYVLDQSGDDRERLRSLHAVRDARAYWRGDSAPEDETAHRLAELLSRRALPSEHVRWALIEPVRLYGDILEMAALAPDPASLGKYAREAIEEWAPMMPIDHVWASLPRMTLASEMAMLERTLLRGDAARERFRERLRGRFGSVAPIRELLGGAEHLRAHS